jgi:hypothetical protein
MEVQYGGHMQRIENVGIDKGGLTKLRLSCLIFESSVERGIPSLAAALCGPATFPLLSAKAALIISFS